MGISAGVSFEGRDREKPSVMTVARYSSSKMPEAIVLLILTVYLVRGKTYADSAYDGTCGVGNGKIGSLNLSIQSQRNSSREWVTTFMTSRDSDDSTKAIKLDLNQIAMECDGKKIVQVHGILRDTPVHLISEEGLRFHQRSDEGFRFHPNVAKNIVLTNNGKTAYRKNPETEILFATAMTNRILNREEMFEVRIDKNISKHGDNLVVGVTTHEPSSIVYPDWMNMVNSYTCMMYKHQVRKDGSQIKNNYGIDMRTIKAGDRVGVMVKSDGTLHFYVNGVDQGPAASNVPNNVYGFAEIMGNAVQATIIDSQL